MLIHVLHQLLENLTRTRRDERGLAATEYLLLGAIILVIVAVAAGLVGDKVLDLAQRVVSVG